jgi:uncharacterized protein (TIGR00252 family)
MPDAARRERRVAAWYHHRAAAWRMRRGVASGIRRGAAWRNSRIAASLANWLKRWGPPQTLGERGERAAAKFLRREGFKIVATRWRNRFGEHDLVAVEGNTIVFVEVKTRRSEAGGRPAAAIDLRRQQRLIRSAAAFLKHDQTHFRYRRRGQFARQGADQRLDRHAAGTARAAVRMQKLDPYINVDPGTMSPYQHGEVYVLDDGSETDLDLGHYERFTNSPLTRDSQLHHRPDLPVGDRKGAAGEFLGKTVQVIPHITNEIKAVIRKLAGTTSTW